MTNFNSQQRYWVYSTSHKFFYKMANREKQPKQDEVEPETRPAEEEDKN